MKTEELTKKIDSSIEKLFEELQQGKSDRFIQYLQFCSKFHNYSLNNILLIVLQMPTASRVAGFVKWKELGYKIKKGSKAIKIFRPQKYKYILDENNNKIFYKNMTEEQKKDVKNHLEAVTYQIANVFDVSQVEKVDNNIVDSFFYNIGNDFKNEFEKLKTVIENNSIQVLEERTEKMKGAEGISYGGLIKIKKDLEYNNKFLTLIHEYAHELMDHGEKSDRDKTNKQIRECRAEAVSYIVSSYYGLHNPFTSDYLQSWGNSCEELKQNLQKVTETANKIITQLEQKTEEAA